MKIEIKKSELPVLKQALRQYSWQLHNNKYISGDFDICEDNISLSYRVSLLKKLAMIEKRFLDEAVKLGYQKRKQSQCWWMWTAIDKFWYKTREAFSSKAEQKMVESWHEDD